MGKVHVDESFPVPLALPSSLLFKEFANLLVTQISVLIKLLPEPIEEEVVVLRTKIDVLTVLKRSKHGFHYGLIPYELT